METGRYTENQYIPKLQRRLRLYDHYEKKYDRLDRAISFLRAAIVLVGVVFVFLFAKTLSGVLFNIVVFFLVLLFFYLVWAHARLKRSIARLKSLQSFTKCDFNRIGLEWDNIPASKSSVDYANDATALDMNITGRNSLVHLIDTTTSSEAHELLLRKLLETGREIEAIEYDQRLIQSLIPKYLLLSKLCVTGEQSVENQFNKRDLLRLLAECEFPKWKIVLLIVSSLVAFINIVLFALFDSLYLRYTYPVYIGLILISLVRADESFSKIIAVKHRLNTMIGVFSILARRFDADAPELSLHLKPIHNTKTNPVLVTTKVSKTIEALSLRAFALAHILVNAIIPWDQYFTYRFSSQRDELLEHFGEWVDVTTELEAYCSLAHFARLNPNYVTPSIIPIKKNVRSDFICDDIGHPLIDREARVVNDFSMASEHAIGIVTGSNMSGKSAFLRTIGINVCLAQAGTVVCASNFVAPSFKLVTCIDVKDDLENGKSLFYVEIEKLRQIKATLSDNNNYPVMFLIDEILKGTNNKERIIGGERYLRSLSEKSGFGLVTTHDVEFSKLADDQSAMFNIHFQESVVDGKMVFDHKLRSGPCRTTNALRIMETENLI